VSVPARRRQVGYSRERGLSVRRACTLFKVARSALSYQGRKAAKDAPVVERMRELSAQYPRYGYRRIRIFLGRGGYRMSPGRAYRLWRAAGLQLPRKRPRKRVAAARPRPCGPNQVWSYDFVFDRCANGQQLKCLTVTDEFTKEGLAIEVDGRATRDRSPSAPGQRAGRTGLPAQRQRPGVRVEGDLVLYRRTRDQHRVDRARQALAECRHGKLQRQVS
jgi:putative transposase